MASKLGLAGGVPERRVRPIWDAVDSRQFKAALKLSVALLAKYPNSPYALALKALILEKMGKPDEALSMCLNAKELLCSDNAVHIDDLTLNTLQIVFQRLDRLDLATSCYEHACGKYPNNLEIMMGLFNCYVREYSYVKQQQTAIKMYKIVGEERFLLWAVCSIQLQVLLSSGGDKLLLLAEALLKKHINSHSLHEAEALAIYISILEQQAKYDTALEVLSGNLGSLIAREEDKLRMKGRLLSHACNYAAAAEVFQKVLESCPDDWESFLHYLGCLLEDDTYWSKVSTSHYTGLPSSTDSRESKETHLTEEVFDSRLSNALSFVQMLQKDTHDNCVRGPYLANLEIEKRYRLNGRADDGKFMEALLDYFYRFSHLSCFASDVELFFHMLTQDEKAELLEKFSRISEASSTSPIKKIGQAITNFKVQELFGAMFTRSNKEHEDTAIKMVKMFCENLPLSRDLDPQENMHGEELLSMASNILVLLFWRTRNLGYLLEAIFVLEFGLTIRRYVWQYKISLLHLYSYLGALPLAYEWYGTLEVKNILLETLSHHILPQILKSPFWHEAADLVKEYLKFMDDHLREAADLTFLAYRHRNYTKVIEFVQFKERLQHSEHYLMARIESFILQLKQKADSVEEIEFIFENVNYGMKLLELSTKDKLTSLTFNEDLQARPWWSPTSSVNFLSEPYEEGSACFRAKLCNHKPTEKTDIERKSLIPRLVYLSMQAASSSIKENIEPNGLTSETSVVGELRILLDRYAMSIGLPIDVAIDAIAGISKGQKSFKDFPSDVISCINFAVFFNSWNLSSKHPIIPSKDNCSPSSWHIVDSLIKTSIMEQLTHAEAILTSPGSCLPVLVQLVTESFSWHILVVQCCMRSMLPHGKKKKRSSSADQVNLPQLQAIRDSVQCLSNTIQEIQKWLEDQMSMSEENAMDTLLSYVHRRGIEEEPGRVLQILEENAAANNSELGERIAGSLQSWSSASVVRKMVRAQHSSLSEFRQLCHLKLKLLDSLKQST
ncbi:N-terminal acetyltransferase B complex auxiliary subunit NAA25 isoform X1 [Typha latifolia]|uniref:N-terminal acetyltransferase B complex auxiliary subunit NAA25 isoform X1 n=1 Tax=Typha latifolia TaxID=4733 RepID=UPI003C2E886B